jgi:translocation and assembly module TamB
MTEPAAPRRRRVWKFLLILVAAWVVISGCMAWYLTTDSFQSMVHRRLVAELERVTGGRVELGSFHAVPFRFQVEVRNVTIHGKEAPGEVPYAHVDGLVAHVKLISVLGAEFGFSSLVLERPIIHIITYPDGSTNQPQPQGRSDKSPVEQLFSMSIGRLELRNGELLLNNQKIPLDFKADDVYLSANYSFLHRRYEGDLLVGKADTQYQDFRPVAWMLKTHFLLSENSVEFRNLDLTSGRSKFQGNARLADFLQPKVDGNYDAMVDLAEIGAIVRQNDVRKGMMEIQGTGAWSLTDYSSAGKLSVQGLECRVKDAVVRNASATTNFEISNQRLNLTQIQAKLFGGDVAGQAEVTNWTVVPVKNAKKIDEQKGSVSLRLKGISIGEVASALATAARPFDRLKLAGFMDGSVETRWRGSPNAAETAITMTLTPPARLAPGQLPVTASGRGVYRSAAEELELHEFTASTRATQVSADGILSSRAQMHVALHTSDLSEWEPVLSAVGYREPIPVTLRGEASFTGTAAGKLSAIQFFGKLESQNFDVLIPATSHAPAHQLRWDSLVADVGLSPNGFAAHNGTLRHGDATVSFDLSAGLQNRQFVESSPFMARVNVQNAEVEEVLNLAGYPYPATGTANISLQAHGTRADPKGTAQVVIADGTFQGQSVPHFESRLDFVEDEIKLSNVHLTYKDTPVTGSGSYNLRSHAFQFAADGNGFDLDSFPQVRQARMSIEGKVDIHASGEGTPEAPVLNAHLQFHNLAFDHELAGDYALDAVTHGADMHVTGRSAFKGADLSIDGDVHLRDRWPAKISAQFGHLDIDSFLRTYLKGEVTGHSAVAGMLEITGPLRQPEQIRVDGNVNDLFTDVEHIQVRNNGPVRFAIANNILDIQQFRLIGQGTDLSAAGSVQLDGEHQLNLRASGDASLKLVESYDPAFNTAGTVSVDVQVKGTIAAPSVLGRLQVSSASIAYADLPSSLSALNGSLIFNQNRLQIESLTGHVGGGTVSFGGYASIYQKQLNFDLSLKGQDVRLRYPQGVSSMANVDLRFAGTTAASTLTGEATVTRLAITPNFDFGGYVVSTAQSAALPQTNPLLNRIRMDVHIVTVPELQMQTAALRLSGDADLHLKGTAAKPVLLGRANVIEGQIYFNGQKYRMERGEVTFTNPVTTTPVLDLQAATHVREYDITVNLNGEFDKLNLTYHSEPPLPSSDIISLLALGRTQEQSAQLQSSGQGTFGQQASSAALAEALNSALSSRARSLFGISHIKVDPQGLNTETSPTTAAPAVTIEQQVADNLTISYSTSVSQTSQQIIQGEYNFTRNVSLLGIRDYNGVVSFEIRIRQRKR